MADCDFEFTFTCFPGGEVKRPCVLEQGHPGNHVVVEPNGNRQLQVLQDGGYYSRSGHANVREYYSTLFAAKHNS